MSNLINNQGIPFTKMEGLGNDYIYINDLAENLSNLADLAVEMSERHYGIGSDGIIVLRPSSIADFKMRMFNLDGSEGKMCGNGIRCLAKFIYDQHLWSDKHLTIETLSGVKQVELIFNQSGQVTGARVNMGQPILENSLIPVQTKEANWLQHPFTLENTTYQVTAVSMGNPHLVIFHPEISQLDLQSLGPKFEHHECFPEKINTEFAEIIRSDEINMRVWERGSGETLACGTGACAVAVASILNGFTDNTVTVNLLGGSLIITWDTSTSGDVYMEGPARTRFSGSYYPNTH